MLFFLGTLYLARTLGPAAFGIWSFAQAWQLYLMRAEDFGLEVTAIREIARNPHNTSEWIANVSIMRLILALGVFAATVVAGMVGFIPLEATKVVILFSLSVFPIAILTEWVYEAKQNVIFTSFSRIAKGGLFVVGVLVFVRGSTALVESTIIYLLSLSIPTVIIFLHAIRRYGFGLTSFSISRGVSALRMSSFVGVATVLSHYSLFAGTMVIGYLLTQADLGLFSAAHRVAVLPWAYVFVSFQRVLLPSL
jgi:O-antigen/teichoic acid export membrane protein